MDPDRSDAIRKGRAPVPDAGKSEPRPTAAAEARRAERLLRGIAEETAATTGTEFFHSLARSAAKALGARYAFVAETLSELESRSLAFWEGTDFGAGFTYRFPGTPCQRVAAGHVCSTPTGLRERFPEDLWLQQIGADSYVGVPMRNAQGRTIGHLAVLHTEPMEPSEDDIATLKIFAARGCAELERKRSDDRLARAHAELGRLNLEMAALLSVNRAIGHHLHRDVLFGALADCLETVVATDRFGIAIPAPDGELHAYLLTRSMARSELSRPTVLPARGTVSEWILQNGEWYVVDSRDELRDRFPATLENMRQENMESLCALPLIAGERTLGTLFFMAATTGAYRQLQRSFLEQVSSAVAVALDDCLAHEELRRLNDELAARKIAELERQKQKISVQLEETGRALTESEERFRDLFDEAPIAYVHEAPDSRFIRINRSAMRILGLKPEEVSGTYGRSLVPDTPEAQRRLQQAFEAMRHGTNEHGIVLELQRKDNGEPIWIQWWSRPDPSGQYTRTMFVDITDRVRMEREKSRLEAQNVYLQEEIRAEHDFTEIVGNSRALRDVLQQVERIAPTDSTVLILGETGTGKELIARAIHDRSPRQQHPLVKVNCGAISAGLVESELFGHVKGAFTGALEKRDGRFKVADGGTIFLDEVSEMPLDAQVKLLRVLQEHEFEPIGGNRSVKVDVRVIAASNRDLEAAVREGRFRSDLYYRLNVVPIRMPPLRERAGDVRLLTSFFVQRFARKLDKQIRRTSDETLERLAAYPWPGNIRELQNVIERAMVLSQGDTLALPADFGPLPAAPASRTRPAATGPGSRSDALPKAASDGALEDVERRHIEKVLIESGWKIEGRHGAARILSLNPSTLRSRMRKLGIQRPDDRAVRTP